MQIEGLYYLTYVAYDGVNALGALALSSDMIHFEKMGIIVPQISYEEFKHLAACQGELDEKYSRYNSHNHLLTISSKNIFVWDKNVIFFFQGGFTASCTFFIELSLIFNSLVWVN